MIGRKTKVALALSIAGIACILYGVTVMVIWSGTWFFAFWYVLGAVLLGAAWAVQAGTWGALPAGVRHAAGAVCLALVAVVLVTQACILRDFDDRGEDGLDYVIVLGAQVFEDRPSVVLAYRLDAACDYLARNEKTRCIVSGGRGRTEPACEADVMASYLMEKGIGQERIIVEDRSRNTVENILYSSEFVDPANDRVGIVTNDFHLFRGLGIARKHGFAHVCGIAAPSSPFYLPNNMVRESFSIAKDFLTGNL
ncbi:MAG: YdcF family protein [Eggerthellaceae bacterium]|nr:YdcF family protein [Eggerthellaceae bacterium]